MQTTRHELQRLLLAEYLATFSLVFVGCGAIVVNGLSGQLGLLGEALTFGLVVTIMIATTGHISGAHINPAVTFAFALSRHFPWKRVGLYWGAQLAGSISGALLLRGLFGNVFNLGATLPAGPLGQSFVLELVMTAGLMFVIMAVATDTKAQGQLAALVVGAAVAANALWGGPISGASLNPARSLGPALVSGIWQAQWIYVLAPFIGAVLGAWLYTLIREPESPA